MRYWICQLRCITLWKPVCGRCSINELEAREAWTHNRVSETFFLKLSEFTRCNGEISGLSSCVRFSDTHNFGSNCDCGWRKWQMHLYLSSKTTKSHSEVLSPFTLVIFQKLSKEHKSKFIHWLLGSWLMLLPRPSLIGSSNSNTGFHKVMRRSFQKWLWPDKFNNAWRTIASIKPNKDCKVQMQPYLQVSSTGGNRQSTNVRREPGKARMGVGKLWWRSNGWLEAV